MSKLHKCTSSELTALVLDGNDLSRWKANKLQQKVNADPQDLHSRAQLLGYYFTRHHFSKKNRILRRTHILWMIQNLAEHPFMSQPWVTVFEGLDPDGYRIYKAAWLKQLRIYPDSASTFANAAASLFMSDLKKAKKIALHAHELNPRMATVKRVIERIQNHEELMAKLYR